MKRLLYLCAQDRLRGAWQRPRRSGGAFSSSVNNADKARTLRLGTEDTALTRCMDRTDAFHPGEKLAYTAGRLAMPLAAKDLRISKLTELPLS